MARYKTNWGGIADTILGFIFNSYSMFVAIVGGGLFLIIDSSEKDKKLEKENAEISITLSSKFSDGQDYKLFSNSIVRIDRKIGNHENSITTTLYDFSEELVMVNGPGGADRVFRFDEFNNDPAINAARDAGCQIGQDVPDLIAAFQEKYDREYPGADALKLNAEVFHAQYCLTAG